MAGTNPFTRHFEFLVGALGVQQGALPRELEVPEVAATVDLLQSGWATARFAFETYTSPAATAAHAFELLTASKEHRLFYTGVLRSIGAGVPAGEEVSFELRTVNGTGHRFATITGLRATEHRPHVSIFRTVRPVFVPANHEFRAWVPTTVAGENYVFRMQVAYAPEGTAFHG